jgi:hypothetical protein
MKRARKMIQVGIAAALGLLLVGCGSLDKPMPKTHFSKDSVQHLYDTGQISQTEYQQMMMSLDANWKPGDPPAQDKKYGGGN